MFKLIDTKIILILHQGFSFIVAYAYITGLSAPVPRGRKGRKGKEVVKEEPKGKNFCTAEALAGLKIDPNIVLGDNGYKKHLHRHSNKLVSHSIVIWASSRENLSSGFPTKRDSNQSPQLQTLARILKFRMKQVEM